MVFSRTMVYFIVFATHMELILIKCAVEFHFHNIRVDIFMYLITT